MIGADAAEYRAFRAAAALRLDERGRAHVKARPQDVADIVAHDDGFVFGSRLTSTLAQAPGASTRA